MLANKIARIPPAKTSIPIRPEHSLQKQTSCFSSCVSPSSENLLQLVTTEVDSLQTTVLACEPDAPNLDNVSHARLIASPQTQTFDHFQLPPCQGFAEIDAAVSNMSISATPLQTSTKARARQLQLPSFESLGIAIAKSEFTGVSPGRLIGMPHTPASSCSSNDVSDFIAASSTQTNCSPALLNRPDSPEAQKRKVDHQPQAVLLSPQNLMLTPPTEKELIDWEANNKLSHPHEDSTNNQQTPQQNNTALPHTSTINDGVTTSRLATLSGDSTWLNEVVQQLVMCLTTTRFPGNQMKFLSQALPTPRVSGHSFPDIVQLIRSRLPPAPLMWINLLHAVPGQFNLADLPTSPPSTPGMPIGGDDYFTSKVFDSAVRTNKEDLSPSESQTSARASTIPAAVPASINLAILERYIPPTSVNELADLYNPYGSSMLTERLVEISPENGCLTFIYPTIVGAQTFLLEYLGPILDPILRSMVVMHSLSSDFSSSLGRMSAVDYLQPFDLMHDKISALCHQLNSPTDALHERLQGMPGIFTIAYAAAHKVTMHRDTWADWWVKQEKIRIRRTIQTYFALASRQPDIQKETLIQEIFDGVKTKATQRQSDISPIEVGVFVIKRHDN